MRFFVFYLMLLLGTAKAQTGNNLRTLFVSSTKDTVQLDSLSIIPGTFLLQSPAGDTVPENLYYFDFINAQLIWNRKALNQLGVIRDTVYKAEFRVFPTRLNKALAHKTTQSVN
ncbi:MAG: hypothetical protein M0D57_01580 [Sphingobacteriales bacterium JAD_PAG50586_3]|nr:MAG: hypothetical protein M0D57_01580 [Sphingobacteriales bacterium JAD_PAG50586_3]